MRIQLPEFDTKKELHSYLVTNKKELIAKKRQLPVFSDVVHLQPQTVKRNCGIMTKSVHEDDEDKDIFRVKVVANTANWIDSHMDMITPGAADKSISERKDVIPHLHDHVHMVDAKVGEVVDIMAAKVSLSELGLDMKGSTESVIFITDIMKSYNEKVFNQYKLGKINQHSIGLRYIKLELAINDEESEKEFDFWNKYIGQAINPDKAIEAGFFWVVKEYMLMENSAVLFGSNELTPTLDNDVKELTTGQPNKDIQEPVSHSDKQPIQMLSSDSIGDMLKTFNTK